MHYLHHSLVGVSLLVAACETMFVSSVSLAAEKLTVRYGPLERSVLVSDLRQYAQTQKASPDLHSFLSYLSAKDQAAVQAALQTKLDLNLVTLDKLLDTQLGQTVLARVATAVVRRDQAGVPALRAAVLLGSTSSDGLSILSFLSAYPSQRLVVDLPKALKLLNSGDFYPSSDTLPPKDTLSASILWQLEVQYQKLTVQGRQYQACLFGDSITAELGNQLGPGVFNFALDGLSTISLVEQLKLLSPAQPRCQKAIIAIGGNDAWYELSDDLFVSKLREAITLVRGLGMPKISLIPAFYSTVAASQNPGLAAPLKRVDQINALMNQVAASEGIPVEAEGIQPLYNDNILKDNLTTDGDHLNAEGLAIYQQALLMLIQER